MGVTAAQQAMVDVLFVRNEEPVAPPRAAYVPHDEIGQRQRNDHEGQHDR